ncbi:MAG: PAS domain S-box protein [Clostridia bacterium]|nr:PAS domain S-box protein [Clostridia bacterium]
MAENILQSVLRQLTIGYALCRPIYNSMGAPADLIFLEANPTFEKMTGLSSGSLSGKSIMNFFGEVETEECDWAGFYGEALRAYTGSEIVRHAEILGQCYKITAFSPEPGQFVVALQDETHETQNMRALERQKNEIAAITAELETIFNSTHDAMFLMEYKNGEFTYVRNNQAHQKLIGYSNEEISGKTPEQLLGAETGKAFKENYLRCVAVGGPISYEETTVLRGVRRDWLANLTPLRKGGEIRYLVGSRTDITEIRRLRRDKEALFQRLSSMFTGHTATMLLIDPESGVIRDANPSACEFYGYSLAELISMNIKDINMLPEDEVERRRIMAFHEKQRYFLFPHRLKSGEIRLVDVYSCPIAYDGKTELFSIIFDVTDRERYREALNHEKELLSVTLHSIGDGVITTGNDGCVTSLNNAAEEITGWLEEEAIGVPFAEIIRLRNEDTGIEVENPISLVMKTGTIIGLANHTVLIKKDGQPVPIADSAAPIRNEGGESFGVVMVFRDVSQDKEQRRQILFLSYHDPLTGLYNRRFLEEQMKVLDTEQYLPLAMVMGDVNGLKITNDVFGHETGDTLLQKVAETLQENCRSSDIIARWGGDEFLIMMPRTGLKEAEKLIERVKRSFAGKSEGTLQLSVSLGCSVKEKNEESLHRTLREAEEWMYHQKLLEGSSYRNTIINTLLATLYEKSMETEEHAERLKDYCGAVGLALKLTAEELNELALLAILHDIGKVGIHQSILKKPGPLTPDEWEEMKRHSEVGYRISQNAPELSVVSDYILSHHERWDGKGYPRRLKGEEIPLFCRILSVADAYDAMTSDRVYRSAMPAEQAKEELRRNAGTQFDPAIVEVFLKLLAQKG